MSSAHIDMFNHLIEGDGDSAEKHRDFYDEYLAVMDLDRRILSADRGARLHPSRGAARPAAASRRDSIDLKAIKRTALLTVEGEKDDISGVGQT